MACTRLNHFVLWMGLVAMLPALGCDEPRPSDESHLGDDENHPMKDAMTLQQLRNEQFFSSWDEFVAAERIEASEANLRDLIDTLIALGPNPTEESVRQAVDASVRRFNDLDDGWIATIEREDIYEQVCRIVDASGFYCDEDWLSEREW